jgi:hypothetical protein
LVADGVGVEADPIVVSGQQDAAQRDELIVTQRRRVSDSLGDSVVGAEVVNQLAGVLRRAHAGTPSVTKDASTGT